MSVQSASLSSKPRVLIKQNVGARKLSIENVSVTAGAIMTAVVKMTAAGDENALSFSLSFDPTKVTFKGATLAAAMSTASLVLNSNQAAPGKLGFVVSVPAGQTTAAGTFDLLNLSFQAGANPGSATLVFANSPAPKSLSDPLGNDLVQTYSDGTITIQALSTVLPPTIVTQPLSQQVGAGASLILSVVPRAPLP